MWGKGFLRLQRLFHMDFRPEYYVVLEALASGPKTPGEVADMVSMEEHDVNAILNVLLSNGLVKNVKKGLLFKREAYTLTIKGWDELFRWRDEVKAKLEEVSRLRGEGKYDEAEALLVPLASILPMLFSLGVINEALWLTISEELGEAHSDSMEIEF